MTPFSTVVCAGEGVLLLPPPSSQPRLRLWVPSFAVRRVGEGSYPGLVEALEVRLPAELRPVACVHRTLRCPWP